MKKISKKSVTKEHIYEAEDGRRFLYEGHAIEHDIKTAEEDMADMQKGSVNMESLNLVGNIYGVETEDQLDLLTRYCELKDFSLDNIEIPTNVIITDNFVITSNELMKVASEISEL